MLYNFEQLPSRDLIEMAKLGRGSKPLDLMSHSPEDNQPSIIGIAEDDRQGLRAILNWTEKRRSQSIQLSGLGAAPLHDCSFRSESCSVFAESTRPPSLRSCRAKEIAFQSSCIKDGQVWRSNCGHRPAVNDIFCPGDGSGARGGKEGDEVCHFSRTGRAPDRDAAE